MILNDRVSDGFRWFQMVSDVFRWFQMVSDGFRVTVKSKKLFKETGRPLRVVLYIVEF